MEYGNYVICYNGEIIILNKLENSVNKGLRFKSSGDTEVLIAGWNWLGTRNFKRLTHILLSIWDKK